MGGDAARECGIDDAVPDLNFAREISDGLAQCRVGGIRHINEMEPAGIARDGRDAERGIDRNVGRIAGELELAKDDGSLEVGRINDSKTVGTGRQVRSLRFGIGNRTFDIRRLRFSVEWHALNDPSCYRTTIETVSACPQLVVITYTVVVAVDRVRIAP